MRTGTAPKLVERRIIGGASADPVRLLGVTGRVALAGIVLLGSRVAAVDPVIFLFYGSYTAVATVLLVRRPRNLIGWILLTIAWGFLGVGTTPYIDAHALMAGRPALRDSILLWFNGSAGATLFVGYAALAILFPTGRPPCGTWRRPALGALGVSVVLALLSALAPRLHFNPTGGGPGIDVSNPFAVLPDLPLWSASYLPTAGIVVGIALVAVGAGTMIDRYRRADGATRLQLRWLMASIAFVAIAVAAGLLMEVLSDDRLGALSWIPALAAFPTVPLAIGIAVVRYRLFEIDRLISRTVAWALITGAVVTVFVAGVVALEALLAGVTQRQTLAVAASTLAAFALFGPLRRRVQDPVNRRFDRSRYDAQRAVDAFAEGLRDEVDLAAISDGMLATVAATVRPRHAAVWIRRPADSRLVGSTLVGATRKPHR